VTSRRCVCLRLCPLSTSIPHISAVWTKWQANIEELRAESCLTISIKFAETNTWRPRKIQRYQDGQSSRPYSILLFAFWSEDGGSWRVGDVDASWHESAAAADRSNGARFIAVVVVVPFLHRSTVMATERASDVTPSSFTCDTPSKCVSNEVKQHRAHLLLGLVMTVLGGSKPSKCETSQLSRLTRLSLPSLTGR